MAKKKRELPQPPKRTYGPFRRTVPEGEPSVVADKMAMAMAQGRLEEFLDEEFGDNPHARNLAAMMLGSMGMSAPPTASGSDKPQAAKKTARRSTKKTKFQKPAEAVPPEILAAAENGDIKGLAGLLSVEMHKRTGGESKTKEKPKKSTEAPADEAVIDKSVIDTLIKIASENDVSLDWVLSRALKLYARDYLNTGRL